MHITILLLAWAAAAAAEAQPRPVPWSPVSYGPDGPWPALRVRYGTPPVDIDVYPGGVFYSLLFTPDLCSTAEALPTCLAKPAGLYDVRRSTTAFNVSGAGFMRTVINETFSGTQTIHGDAAFGFDTLTLPGGSGQPDAAITNATILTVSRGFKTLSNGKKYAPVVGNLALGAPDRTMIFGSASGSAIGSIAGAFLFERDQIPSYSFGIHIGSPSLGIPGSLYFGGYDKARIVGPVSTQQYDVENKGTLPIDLVDISIGTAGALPSPFSFTSKTGLLAKGNSSLAPSLRVFIEPLEPYLYLPDSTCRAIAAELPVIFSADLGLYLWDTANPAYEKIMTSPTSYLAFTFRLNSSISTNFEIKVPFKLLNLTLTAPLAERPTAYFPCSLPRLNGTPFRLGRAFLQAAFVGVNWMDPGRSFFLAQAPGPGLRPPSIGRIEPKDTSVVGSEVEWITTWQADARTSPDAPPQAHEGPRVNVGLIAGATVGGVIALLLAGGVFWWWRRRVHTLSSSQDTSILQQPILQQRREHPQPPGYIEQERPKSYIKKHEREEPAELSTLQSPRFLQSKELPTMPPVELPT